MYYFKKNGMGFTVVGLAIHNNMKDHATAPSGDITYYCGVRSDGVWFDIVSDLSLVKG